ncbi:hypothetical protein [Variovorax ginsengisoli]|uniref:Uncharacterized protein n=1 Tax=Variovorax ginsengisoli TaxID=363844 RepID=A0ABT8SDN7_9BURK|nr:hypothetical protein [Variovorax ginsengisoli]MDN8617859.1 hypothetical protein [Variovorax ginsengisoli]MDO1537029.1 hypothetical protein [Variovorax ginsengisoli]
MAVLSRNVAVEALEALGLPTERAMSLRLEFDPACIVTATVTYAVEDKGLGQVLSLVKRRKYLDEQPERIPSNPTPL